MLTRTSVARLTAVSLLWALMPPGPAAAGGDGADLDGMGADACRAGKLELAFESKALDDDTGRDLRHFPPDRVVDYEHMTLSMRFEDLNDAGFTATETLRFTPIAGPVGSLTLDSVGLDIRSVTLQGSPVEHYQDDEDLTLRFDPPLSPATSHEIVIEYGCSDPADGMIFTPSFPEAPDYGAEVHTHGETDTNSYWFPCHDFPNEKLTTELIVDVPTGFSVCSNGRLVSSTDDGSRAVWHYLQDKPHTNYLVSLCIGTYDIVPIPHDRVPMQVWVPQGLGHLVLGSYGRTGEMLDVFEDRFGVPYPWARYDQILVKNFGAGGMENTSATTMYPTAVLDEVALADRDLEGLISHELAHQWGGDLYTCKSWAHIWLNEGMASYGTALWYEHRDGEDGYLDTVRRSFRVARRDKTSNDLPMVTPIYANTWEPFSRAANPYSKGSSILHMLRMMLGDEVFFKALGEFMNRYSFRSAETNDFRYVMEEVSGLGLEWFFDQWFFRPGTPNLDVAVRYDGRTRGLEVTVEQTQEIDERTPAFRFTLPIYVETAERTETFEIDVREQTTAFNTVLDGPPVIVAVDPFLHVLKTIDVDKPQQMWINQAKKGPTIAARHAAVSALGRIDTPETIDLLADLITDETVRYTLRQTAVNALAEYASRPARARLLAIVTEGVDHPRVRAALVRTLRDFDADEVAGTLADIASRDPSYAVKVAAIRGLASLEATEHADLIADLVHYPSQHDDVRRAALAALADLDDPRGLDLGIEYSAYGYMDRSRPAAISAIGTLAHHDPDRAVPYLIALLDDPEQRTVIAAGSALVETGDERAKAPLTAVAETARGDYLRRRAERWLEALEEGPEENGPGEDDE